MRITLRTKSFLQVSILAVCLTACNLLGVPESGQVEVTQAPVTPSDQNETPPLFEPQSDTVIEPVNASSLAPSNAVVFQGASGFAWLPDNQGAAVAGEQEVLIIPSTQAAISAQSGTPEAKQAVDTITPSLLIAAKESDVIAWVSGGETISILDASVGTDLPSAIQAEAPVTGLALTPVGDRMAYATFARQVVVQDPGSEQVTKSWTTPAWLSNLTYSPDGSQLAGADQANFTIYFQDATTGEVLRKLEWLDSATSSLYGVYLSPDWRQAAWVAQSVVQLMDAEDGKAGPLLPHQDVVRAVAWSTDGSQIATGLFSGEIIIWDYQTGKTITRLVHNELGKMINDVEWSPDGNRIAFYRFDESQVPEFSMTEWGDLYPTVTRFKYPKAGEKNSLVTLHIYNVTSQFTTPVDLGEETDQDYEDKER